MVPNPAAVIRLMGAILLELDDKWAVAERRYFSAKSIQQLTAPVHRSYSRRWARTNNDVGRGEHRFVSRVPSHGGRALQRPQ